MLFGLEFQCPIRTARSANAALTTLSGSIVFLSRLEGPCGRNCARLAFLDRSSRFAMIAFLIVPMPPKSLSNRTRHCQRVRWGRQIGRVDSTRIIRDASIVVLLFLPSLLSQIFRFESLTSICIPQSVTCISADALFQSSWLSQVIFGPNSALSAAWRGRESPVRQCLTKRRTLEFAIQWRILMLECE
jgi:hypothetical protein